MEIDLFRRTYCLLFTKRKNALGFTIIEVMLVMGALGILMAIAIPVYQSYRAKLDMAQVIIDMGAIDTLVKGYELDSGTLPDNLEQVGWTKPDKWGNAYYYLKMEGASVGKKRKDRSLHPLNSDYDLYSSGPDGKTTTPLTAKISQDDIIRANNGSFIGIAANY